MNCCSVMGLISLPLHVWDREIDARILLGTIAANNGNLVILGDEYNISPLYKEVKNIFHYGAGRPIYDTERTINWYEQIIRNDGFVGLTFEEGINDLNQKFAKMLYDGINLHSAESLTEHFSWSKQDKDLLINSTPSNLRHLISSKISIVSNIRLELLGKLGKKYFIDKTISIRNLFGRFILISDNFGDLESFGSLKPLNIKKELNERLSSDEVRDHLELKSLNRDKRRKARDYFCKTINNLVSENPNILFVLRPHPTVDQRWWQMNINPARNIVILARDSIYPWVNSASAVIHAGCTVGLESSLSGIPTIDISRVYDDPRELGLSAQISNYQPNSYDQLNEQIVGLYNAQETEAPTSNTTDLGDNYTQILENNINTLDFQVVDALRQPDSFPPLISCLLELQKRYHKFFKHKDLLNPIPKSEIANFSKEFGRRTPQISKSRFYSLEDISRRVKSACLALKLPMNIIVSKPSVNVFILRKE